MIWTGHVARTWWKQRKFGRK